MRLKRMLLLLVPGLLLVVISSAQDKWDLRRCVDYAVANNISIKQSDVQARLARLTLDQSKLYRIPNLSAGIGYGVNSGHNLDPATYNLSTVTYNANSLSVQSSVTLFNFGSLRNTIAANRYNWEATLASTDKLKNDISLSVANAYLQVLLSTEQTRAAEAQLHLSQNSLEITRKQVNAGTLPELNAAELEAQVAQDSSTFISTKATIVQNILSLKAYMGLDASTPFEVATPPIDQIPVERLEDLQPEAVYALALTNQPLQKMDQLQVRAYQKSVAATHGAMYPNITASASMGSNYISTYQTVNQNSFFPIVDTIGRVVGAGTKVVADGVGYSFKKIPYFSQLNQNFSQSIGLNISIPIFNNGTLRTSYERSKLNLHNTELQRDQDNLTLKENVYQAYTAALTALQKFEANKVSAAATRKSYEFAQKRYNVGMLNTIDLLTNQNNYFSATINLLYSQFDYVFKLKVLEFYKGMGIKL
jgi:outer membrane protein